MREKRRLAAIVAADVVGYSRLMGRDESGTLARLREHRHQRLEPVLARRGGRIVKLTGDGALMEFSSAVEALSAAIEFQQAVTESVANLPEAERLVFRVGVHLGDVIVDGDDLYGDGVNVAARLEGEAPAGGIVASSAVHEAASGRLKATFDDLGRLALKNIERPVQAYTVRWQADDWPRETSVASPPLTPVPSPPDTPLPLPDKPSIAVLPFQNMSGDPEQEYFADGLVEDIITGLSYIRWLFVIARNSSFTYKGKSVDIKLVGRELGVRYVLEGSVRKGGNRVRITAQLIDAVSGAHVWAERYDRDLGDIFAVQDELTATVAGLIEPALAQAEQQRAMRKPPERLDAWEAYQRGLWHFHKYAPEENQKAIGFFRRAIALDPQFAPGHHGYALAMQWDIWHFSQRPLDEVQGIPRAEARTAVTLDDKDAMAHAVLAHMMMWGGEWEAAIAQARTGVALNPNSAFVISMLGCTLCFGGHRDEAIERLHQAMRASPHDPLTWLWTLWLAAAQLFAGQYEPALEAMHQLARLRPEYPPLLKIACLAHMGRLEEAQSALAGIPAESMAQFRHLADRRPPFMRPEDFASRQEGLRLAGLPE
ncbi:MAG: adenylate/guanylate cyclase domain-containing protein [Hyphomicrobiaceae bacterium]